MANELAVEYRKNKPPRVDNVTTEQETEYEDAKREYEESSKNHEIIQQGNTKSNEEIDVDLDDFEAQERHILGLSISEEQKKIMLEQLYSNFDNYTESASEKAGKLK